MYRDLYHYEEKIRAIIAIRICGVALWSVVLLYSLFKFVYFVLDYWNLPIGLDYSTSQVLYLWVIICGHSINKGFVFIENDFSENYIVLVLNSILTPSRNILNLMMMIFLNFFILNSLVKSVLYDGEAITMTSFEILTYSILFTANFCTNFRNFDWPVVKSDKISNFKSVVFLYRLDLRLILSSLVIRILILLRNSYLKSPISAYGALTSSITFLSVVILADFINFYFYEINKIEMTKHINIKCGQIQSYRDLIKIHIFKYNSTFYLTHYMQNVSEMVRDYKTQDGVSSDSLLSEVIQKVDFIFDNLEHKLSSIRLNLERKYSAQSREVNEFINNALKSKFNYIEDFNLFKNQTTLQTLREIVSFIPDLIVIILNNRRKINYKEHDIDNYAVGFISKYFKFVEHLENLRCDNNPINWRMRDFLSQNTEFYSKLLNLIDFSKRQEGVLIYRIVRDKLVTSFGKLMKVKIENYIAN